MIVIPITLSFQQCNNIIIRSTTTNNNNNNNIDLGYHSFQKRIKILYSQNFNNDNTNNNNESIVYDTNNYNVTDEEALLACRAYLQRKNRVGWTQAKERKKLALNSLALPSLSSKKLSSSSSSSSSRVSSSSTTNNNNNNNAMDDSTLGVANLNTGYFWEDPSELIYLKKGRRNDNYLSSFSSSNNDNEDENNDNNNNDEDIQFDQKFRNLYDINEKNKSNYNNDDEEEEDDEEEMKAFRLKSTEDEDSEESGIFTSFPMQPSTTHMLQSQAKKERFKDPKWKAKWYEKRWGKIKGKQVPTGIEGSPSDIVNKTKQNDKKRQKRIKQLIQRIPSEILRSPELASLSDTEIEEAIQTYVVANKRRRESHLKRSNDRKKLFKENSLNAHFEKKSHNIKNNNNNNNDSNDETNDKQAQLSFIPNEEELKRLQKKRSQTAIKAYATRLRNQKVMQEQKDSELSHDKQSSSFIRQIRVEGELSPRQAMERVEEMMKVNEMVYIHDIDAIMEPKRLGGRIDLFRAILKTYFNLRGKCVPDLSKMNSNPHEFYSDAREEDMETMPKKFVTKCTVVELGSFIKYLLKRTNNNNVS